MLGRDLIDAFKGRFELAGVGLGDGSRLGIPYEEIDLTDAPRVEAFWDRTKPDLIFHLAAMTNVDLCETEKDAALRANTRAVEIVAGATKRQHVPLVFFSTDFVFDGKKTAEYAEDEPRAPLSYYGETKRLAEDSIRQCGVSYVIFRICWLYGLHGRSFPRAILDIAAKQKILNVVDDQIGRPTYTRDLCAAFCKLLDQDPQIFFKKAGNIFHLGNSGTASWADFAAEILRLAGYTDHKVQRIGWRELDPPRAARRPEHAVLSLEKARRELGIQTRPWQEALGDFMREYSRSCP